MFGVEETEEEGGYLLILTADNSWLFTMNMLESLFWFTGITNKYFG
jgi:hypothetical protein